MLPFLKAKKLGSILMARHKPDGGMEPMNEEGEHKPELMSAAEALISAIHAKDATAVAQALKDADATMDMDQEPMEGELE